MARTESDAGAGRERIERERAVREEGERGGAGRAPDSPARAPEFRTYEEFWSHYMGEHDRPATRWLHTVGTVGSVALAVFFVATGRWLWLPAALVPGYGLSWIGHFFVEHNRPATFGHPAWSMLSDFRMVWLVLTGRVGRELARLRGGGGR